MGSEDRHDAAPASLGLLIVNKEAGPTSHDIVRRVRRCLGERRVGHAGTLDPFARGVLVVCVGDATRLVEYVMRGAKVYDAEVMFGIETETDDTTGQVTREVEMAVDEGSLRSAIEGFVGEIEQAPPRYSAVKIDGERMYRSARRGERVEPPVRRVRIRGIELVALHADPRPRARLTVTCEQGTYIRALARDLGRALGGCAVLSRLVRLRVGRFGIEDAICSRRLVGPGASGVVRESLMPIGLAVADLPRIDVAERDACRFVSGNAVPGTGVGEVAVWFGDLLLGVGRAAEGMVGPRKVLSGACRLLM
jgi:tRNA pseudouridine55 synthase